MHKNLNFDIFVLLNKLKTLIFLLSEILKNKKVVNSESKNWKFQIRVETMSDVRGLYL